MGKNEGRGWALVAILLLIGLLCVFVAGNRAIRFAPRWALQADMRSRLNPDGAYYTPQPGYVLPPLDPAILTPPVWINLFLTPGYTVPTRVQNATSTPPNTSEPTQVPPTGTPTITSTVTATFLFFTPTKSSTSNVTSTGTSASMGTVTPGGTPTATSTPARTATPTATSTATSTPTRTVTPTATSTATSTATGTATPTATSTATSTPTATSTETSTPTATPTHTPIYTDPTPGEIGPNPDGNVYNLLAGRSLTLDYPIDVNGHAGPDLVYYELPMGSGIWLDWVIVEISDGSNWYTVFNWGDNFADGNTNMNFDNLSDPVMGPVPPPEEPDQRDIQSDELYNSTGIAIDLDSVVLPGSYFYLRFTCPTSVGGVDDTDGKMEIDAIERLN